MLDKMKIKTMNTPYSFIMEMKLFILLNIYFC